MLKCNFCFNFSGFFVFFVFLYIAYLTFFKIYYTILTVSNKLFKIRLQILERILLKMEGTKMKHLVVEGDWGGQIYLSVPFGMLLAGCEQIDLLAKKIDRFCWPSNRDDGVSVYEVETEAESESESIPGGMGGGRIIEGLWLHEEIERFRGGIEGLLLKGDESIFNEEW